MKKRIVLSLLSFFMVTAMWASISELYKLYLDGTTAKTNQSAKLTLKLKNKTPIKAWECKVILPAGMTYEANSIQAVSGRYEEGFNAQFTETIDGTTVTFACEGESTITGTDGAVAEFTVNIPADFTPGDYTVTIQDIKTIDDSGTSRTGKASEFTWTIEQGEEPFQAGDVNKDNFVDIADVVSVLNIMAQSGTPAEYPEADVNNDTFIDIADVVSVLNIMAAQ